MILEQRNYVDLPLNRLPLDRVAAVIQSRKARRKARKKQKTEGKDTKKERGENTK